LYVHVIVDTRRDLNAAEIEAPALSQQTMMWQVLIHLTFVLSAMAMAFTNRLMDESPTRKQ
jgi:uncharacterized protein (TIGR00645 family)